MAKVVFKKVGILSVAKWQILAGFVTGLFFGAIYFTWGMLVNRGEGLKDYFIFYLILAPLLYALASFLGSLIWGAIYNTFAKTFGGATFEIEEIGKEVKPPPPEKWT